MIELKNSDKNLIDTFLFYERQNMHVDNERPSGAR